LPGFRTIGRLVPNESADEDIFGQEGGHEHVRPLDDLPVLAIGGAESSGVMIGNTMKLTADDVQTLVIPDCGHWLAEQAPDEMLAALTAFLAPYREVQL
jgi:pimeloyl-ACP methyl ester carboxylesterase